MPIGTVAHTIWGNKLKRFYDGWSPLEGVHWDRWTVYSDQELEKLFVIARFEW